MTLTSRSAYLPIAALLAAVTACACNGNGGSGGPNINFNGSKYHTSELARGTVAALPSGILYIHVDEVSGVPASKAPVGAPGIAYVVEGSLSLTDTGGTTSLAAGQAGYVGPTTRLSGDASAKWYFLTVASTAGRSSPPPYAGSQPLFATDDLPSLPVIRQDEVLQSTTLESGGFSPAHRPNGVEVVIDLEGTLEMRGGGADVTHLSAGQAKFVLQGSFVQLVNRGSGSARYLSFFLLPHGTDLTSKA